MGSDPEPVSDIIIVPKVKIEERGGEFVVRLPGRYSRIWRRWLGETLEVWILRRRP